MRDEQLKVQTFMEHANQPVPIHPIIPDIPTLLKRTKWLESEFKERQDAENMLIGLIQSVALNGGTLSLDDPGLQGVLVEIIDSWCDMIYFILGDAVAMGVDLKPFFDEVHASNMSKFIDGKIGPDGKYQKGPNYQPPNLLPILKAQIIAGRARS